MRRYFCWVIFSLNLQFSFALSAVNAGLSYLYSDKAAHAVMVSFTDTFFKSCLSLGWIFSVFVYYRFRADELALYYNLGLGRGQLLLLSAIVAVLLALVVFGLTLLVGPYV